MRLNTSTQVNNALSYWPKLANLTADHDFSKCYPDGDVPIRPPFDLSDWFFSADQIEHSPQAHN